MTNSNTHSVTEYLWKNTLEIEVGAWLVIGHMKLSKNVSHSDIPCSTDTRVFLKGYVPTDWLGARDAFFEAEYNEDNSNS